MKHKSVLLDESIEGLNIKEDGVYVDCTLGYAGHSSEMLEALMEPALQVVDAVHSVLERTPPELVADISDKGIYMTGGGCLVDGLDKLLQEKTGINVMIAQDAVSCVALGTGKALDNLDALDAKKRS